MEREYAHESWLQPLLFPVVFLFHFFQKTKQAAATPGHERLTTHWLGLVTRLLESANV